MSKRKIESAKELEEICLEGRYEHEGGYPWYKKIFYRSISIYVTKIFIKTGMSANQITLMNLFIALIAGLFFTFSDPKYWIIGALLWYVVLTFESVDGEIARYYKRASATGAYWEAMVGLCIGPYRFACMTFGIYNALQDITVFVFGFIAALSLSLSWTSKLYGYRLGLSSTLPTTQEVIIDAKKAKSKAKMLFGYGRVMYNDALIFIIVLLIVAIIDVFVPAITIGCFPFMGSFMINARYVFLIVYGVPVLIFMFFNIYRIFRKGF